MVIVEVAVILCLNNEKGLTLVEVIAAIIIIGVLGMAFAMALITGTQSEIEVSQRYEASSIASSIIDNLRDEKLFGDLTKNGDYSFDDSLESFIEKEIEDVNDLKGRINRVIDRYDELVILREESEIIIVNKDNNLYEVGIIIKWKESGQELSYELRTMLYADKSD